MAKKVKVKAKPYQDKKEVADTVATEQITESEVTQEQSVLDEKISELTEGSATEVQEGSVEGTSSEVPGPGPFKDSEPQSLRQKMEKYFKSYPRLKALYVTSDNTPFAEKASAAAHQKKLDKTKDYETVNR